MNPRPLLVAGALLLLSGPAGAAKVDPKARSVSSSRQFVVYCEDIALRGRVAGFVEDVKADALQLIGQTTDNWKIPIVITLSPARGPVQAPVRVQMLATPEGSKIEITAELGPEPAGVHLQKQILRAVFLEFAWRDRPPVKAGERYLEAPWWLVEGAIQTLRRRDLGVDSDLFRRLTESSKLPPLDELLRARASDRGATAEAIDGAFAMALLQALLEQPNGKANLSRLLRRWPDNGDHPVAALSKDFPSLAGSDGTLEKWWTLNLARFAASERYRGLTAAATDKELSALLQFNLAVDAAGTRKTFNLSEYEKFAALPATRPVLAEKQKALAGLSTQAHALFRPVLTDYQEILTLLSKGKTRGLPERLAALERYRSGVLLHMGEIADYLNWYEATQLGTRTNAFDSYLKAANALSNLDGPRSDAIAHYLDQLQAEF